MQERYRYDAAIKDLFQADRTMLVDLWAHGVAVEESLNVEFAILEQRAADLVLALADHTILHIDVQSTNDPKMGNRMGIYAFMINGRYDRMVRQVVLYIGHPRLTMDDFRDVGSANVKYEFIDIRQFDVETFLASGQPGDVALALLARDGVGRLEEILHAANRLAPQPASRR